MASARSGGARRKRPQTASGRRRAEDRRLHRLLELEQAMWDQGLTLIAGVDEVGRGPLAGPVLAAAVVLPPNTPIRGVDDSKKLTAEKRAALCEEIRAKAIAIGVAGASTREIDRINILRASHLAMRRALERMRIIPDHVFVDGLPVPELGEHCTAVIDGDAKVHAIACASIVAKVVRDRIMQLLATRYHGYGWDTNVGYATAEHRGAIIELGLTPHHRRSFEWNNQLTLEL
ncbi:MAG TPA: ribonuclease HII [Longimicrobiales bacterium]|nr:ribonuclease HII [Longimicrobiales bacterium]